METVSGVKISVPCDCLELTKVILLLCSGKKSIAFFLNRTPRRTVIILAAIWIINCLTLIPLLKIYKIQLLIIDGYPQDYCVELFETDGNRLAYYLTIAVLFYLLPLCVIAFAYGLMARSLWAGVSPAFKKVLKHNI